jgi:hypothetical protein
VNVRGGRGDDHVVVGAIGGATDVTGGDGRDMVALSVAGDRAAAALNTLTLSVETLVVDIGEEEDVPCEGVWSDQLLDVEGTPTPALVFEEEAIPDADVRIAANYTRGDGTPEGECAR